MISGTKTQGAAAVPWSNKKTLMMISKFPTDKKTILDIIIIIFLKFESCQGVQNLKKKPGPLSSNKIIK
jgi:hypothetical protein